MSGDQPIGSASNEEIAGQIDLMLRSPVFAKSERMRTLLRHLTEATLYGPPEKLKEYAIGVDVFDKDASFDPRLDTTVRTEARRLRAKLEEYYQTAGREDAIEIALPKGGYRLAFQQRGLASAANVAPSPSPPRWRFSRYPTAVVFLFIILFISAVSTAWYGMARRRIHSRPAIQSIVVLPLVNLSGDASRQYLADGITDGLITDLATISALRVVSRSSAMSYRSKQKTAREIGHELEVDAIVEGSMTVQGERVRVNAQLINARTDAHLWAATFDRQEKDVLRLETDITDAITREIRVRILPEEQRRLQSGRAMKPEAYDAYMKGRFFISHWTEENWRKARERFEDAVSKDPSSSLAYAGLAAAYGVGLGWAIAPHEAGPKCLQAAETAVALDSSVAEAHRELGGCALFYDWDFPAASRELRKAVELNPANPISHEVLGYYLCAAGEMEEALREHQRAVELNPASLISNTDVGDIYYYQRRYDDAIRQYRRTLELEPGFVVARQHLGLALVQKRMFTEALEELETAARLEPKPWAKAALGYALASASRRADAARVIDEMKAESTRRYVSPLRIAAIYIGMRQPDLALDWVEKAYEVRDSDLVWLKRDPVYDPLRETLRFQQITRRVGLP